MASEIIPASATTVTSVSWWAVLNALMTGTMVAVSALLPSKGCHGQREPGRIGQQAKGDLRFQPALFGEAGLAEPITGIGLEMTGCSRRKAPGWPAPTGHVWRILRKCLPETGFGEHRQAAV